MENHNVYIGSFFPTFREKMDEEEVFLYDDYEDVNVEYKKPVGGDKMKNKEKPTGKGGDSEQATVQKTDEEKGERKAEERKREKKEVKKVEKKAEHREVKKGMEKREENGEEKKRGEKGEIKPKEGKKPIRVGVYIAILILIAAIAAGIYFTVIFTAQRPEAAAVVNGEAITVAELNAQYDRLPEQYRQFLTKDNILDRLIDEKLLLQEAVKQGFIVTDEEVQAAIEDSIEQNMLTEEDFQDLIEEQGLTIDDVKDSYKKQLLITKLLDKEVRKGAEIAEADIRGYYDSLIRASHILVETEEEALEIYNELTAGGNFSEIAKEKSIDTGTAVRGGDLGEFGKGQMVGEFEEVAFSLQTEEISKPVQSQFGWHIIKRTEKKLDYEEVKDKIKDLLTGQKEEELYNGYIEGLRERADIKKIELEGPVVEVEKVEVTTKESCVGAYGLTADSVVFYYTDWCIDKDVCIKSKNFADKLKPEYSFFEAKAVNGVIPAVLGCFDIDTEKVPQFICAGSKEIKTGNLTEKSLREFAEKCRG